MKTAFEVFASARSRRKLRFSRCQDTKNSRSRRRELGKFLSLLDLVRIQTAKSTLSFP
jgi:hypothetical protein